MESISRSVYKFASGVIAAASISNISCNSELTQAVISALLIWAFSVALNGLLPSLLLGLLVGLLSVVIGFPCAVRPTSQRVSQPSGNDDVFLPNWPIT